MIRRNNLHAVMIALIVLASMAAPAGATSILYTDRTTWEAATSGLVTITFEGLATSSTPGNYSTSSGLTLNGVQFTALTPPDSFFLYTEDALGSSNYQWNSGDLLMGPNAGWGGGYILATLPSGGVQSVGTDLMTHTPFGASVTVTLSTGEEFTINTFSNPTRAFAGFTSDTPITWIQFTPGSGFSLIDNFSYGSAPADPVGETPEAETAVLAGAGLLSLFVARRLKGRLA
jgi:hypothetical protein